jgi:hypothetical protein
MLPSPPDAISSLHEPGAIGKRWAALIDGVPGEARDRVNRGRHLARRARLRRLEVTPGGATAEVHTEEISWPTLAVRPFERAEWDALIDALRGDLASLCDLLEGELTAALMAALEARGVRVMPKLQELTFDCSCGDFIATCVHASALHQILSDVVDEDPFQLLTLRGRSSSQLLADLRAVWGEEEAPDAVLDPDEPAPLGGDWFASSTPVPEFACSVGGKVVAGAGVRALGPPPGGADLLGVLLPLYEAGAAAALQRVESPMTRASRPAPSARDAVRVAMGDRPAEDLAMEAEARADALAGPPSASAPAAPVAPPVAATAPASAPPRRAARQPQPIAPEPEAPTAPEREAPTAPVAPPVAVATPATPASASRTPVADDPTQGLTERLVDYLAYYDGSSAEELARALSVPKAQVRDELLDLERLGLVFRSAVNRVSRWHVG